MAYVRRTEELVCEVKAKVNQMRDHALKPYEAKEIQRNSVEYNELYAAVEPFAWRAAPELKDKIPDEWLSNSTFKLVHTRIDYDMPNYDMPNSDAVELRFKQHTFVKLNVPEGSPPFKLPPNYEKQGGYYGDPHADMKLKHEYVPPSVVKWFEAEHKNSRTRDELIAKYNGIRDKLESFMLGHKSLNKMLEAMPDFEHYVPERFMDRIRKPNVKRENTGVQTTIVEELNINTEELVTAAIAHRLSDRDAA